jgi:hypothetical protein
LVTCSAGVDFNNGRSHHCNIKKVTAAGFHGYKYLFRKRCSVFVNFKNIAFSE